MFTPWALAPLFEIYIHLEPVVEIIETQTYIRLTVRSLLPAVLVCSADVDSSSAKHAGKNIRETPSLVLLPPTQAQVAQAQAAGGEGSNSSSGGKTACMRTTRSSSSRSPTLAGSAKR
jgi:hypothetical protein